LPNIAQGYFVCYLRDQQNAGSTAMLISRLFMTILRLAVYEQPLKWLAVALGLLSTIAIVQDWQLAAMIFGLPFCLIWIYCAWLRTEPQLKYINIVFTLLYIYGIARYFVINE